MKEGARHPALDAGRRAGTRPCTHLFGAVLNLRTSPYTRHGLGLAHALILVCHGGRVACKCPRSFLFPEFLRNKASTDSTLRLN